MRPSKELRYYLIGLQDNPDKIWDIKEAKWISASEKDLEEYREVWLTEDLEYLRRTLLFYKKPLGELATPADRIEALIEDNKEYLLKVLLLYSMDMEVPQEALQKFATLKKEILSLADTQSVTDFLTREKK